MLLVEEYLHIICHVTVYFFLLFSLVQKSRIISGVWIVFGWAVCWPEHCEWQSLMFCWGLIAFLSACLIILLIGSASDERRSWISQWFFDEMPEGWHSLCNSTVGPTGIAGSHLNDLLPLIWTSHTHSFLQAFTAQSTFFTHLQHFSQVIV